MRYYKERARELRREREETMDIVDLGLVKIVGVFLNAKFFIFATATSALTSIAYVLHNSL